MLASDARFTSEEKTHELLEWVITERFMVLFQVCFVRSLTKKGKISSRTSESAVATYQSLGALRDTTTDNKAECFHSLHDPVIKSLSIAIKGAIFGKSLLVYLETIRQFAKIDHAQGQIQCSNTCTLLLCQNLFPSSYFRSWQRFLC